MPSSAAAFRRRREQGSETPFVAGCDVLVRTGVLNVNATVRAVGGCNQQQTTTGRILMKLKLTLALATVFLLITSLASAADTDGIHEEKMIIALKTDEFELQETDISHLEVGDAETIVTESGKTIDLLRIEDGVEIYVDGELLEPGAHGDHEMIHKRIEVVCEEEGACEELVWVSEDEGIDLDMLHGEDHEVIVFQEADGDSEETIEIHPGEHHRKVIIIRDQAESE
jgi:hypothetical protein